MELGPSLRITGKLVLRGDRFEAMVVVADFTGRMRALGHDVEDVVVEILAPEDEPRSP